MAMKWMVTMVMMEEEEEEIVMMEEIKVESPRIISSIKGVIDFIR